MDTSAFVLASEQALTMHIFDVAAVGVMRRICEGDDSRHPDQRQEVATRGGSGPGAAVGGRGYRGRHLTAGK